MTTAPNNHHRAARHYAAENLRVLLQKFLDGERLDRAEVRRACRAYDEAAGNANALLGG